MLVLRPLGGGRCRLVSAPPPSNLERLRSGLGLTTRDMTLSGLLGGLEECSCFGRGVAFFPSDSPELERRAYFVPYLSALEVHWVDSEGDLGHVSFAEMEPHFERPPLAARARELEAETGVRFRGVELSSVLPGAVLSVAWYPLYTIPASPRRHGTAVLARYQLDAAPSRPARGAPGTRATTSSSSSGASRTTSRATSGAPPRASPTRSSSCSPWTRRSSPSPSRPPRGKRRGRGRGRGTRQRARRAAHDTHSIHPSIHLLISPLRAPPAGLAGSARQALGRSGIEVREVGGLGHLHAVLLQRPREVLHHQQQPPVPHIVDHVLEGLLGELRAPPLAQPAAPPGPRVRAPPGGGGGGPYRHARGTASGCEGTLSL